MEDIQQDQETVQRVSRHLKQINNLCGSYMTICIYFSEDTDGNSLAMQYILKIFHDWQ